MARSGRTGQPAVNGVGSGTVDRLPQQGVIAPHCGLDLLHRVPRNAAGTRRAKIPQGVLWLDLYGVGKGEGHGNG